MPALAWTNPPANTKSFAITMHDPDGGNWVHWVQFNIPAGMTILAEVAGGPDVGVKGLNDFGELGYSGPCPPSGNHHYIFTLYALDAALSLTQGATRGQVDTSMAGHILGQASQQCMPVEGLGREPVHQQAVSRKIGAQFLPRDEPDRFDGAAPPGKIEVVEAVVGCGDEQAAAVEAVFRFLCADPPLFLRLRYACSGRSSCPRLAHTGGRHTPTTSWTGFILDTQRGIPLYSWPSEASSYHLTSPTTSCRKTFIGFRVTLPDLQNYELFLFCLQRPVGWSSKIRG